MNNLTEVFEASKTNYPSKWFYGHGLFNYLKLKNKATAFVRKEAKKKGKKIFKKTNDAFIANTYSDFGKEQSRYIGIAYSMLRGRKYSQIEKVCKNKVSPEKLFLVFNEIIASHGGLRVKITLEQIKAALEE